MSRVVSIDNPPRTRKGTRTHHPIRKARGWRRLMAAVTLLAVGFAMAPAASAATISIHPVVAKEVLSLLNQERAANHLPALTMNTDLINSAYSHNSTMANYDLLSHQCPGEKSFGDRLDAAHYDWSTAGENIGWTSAMSTSGALGLETYMYNEKAPNNGHRLIILSTAFRDIGISVITDTTHNRLWLTEDFGHLM